MYEPSPAALNRWHCRSIGGPTAAHTFVGQRSGVCAVGEAVDGHTWRVTDYGIEQMRRRPTGASEKLMKKWPDCSFCGFCYWNRYAWVCTFQISTFASLKRFTAKNANEFFRKRCMTPGLPHSIAEQGYELFCILWIRYGQLFMLRDPTVVSWKRNFKVNNTSEFVWKWMYDPRLASCHRWSTIE